MEITGLPPAKIIGNVLNYDRKVTSYRLALLRALRDVALSFPDFTLTGRSGKMPATALAG